MQIELAPFEPAHDLSTVIFHFRGGEEVPDGLIAITDIFQINLPSKAFHIFEETYSNHPVPLEQSNPPWPKVPLAK